MFLTTFILSWWRLQFHDDISRFYYDTAFVFLFDLEKTILNSTDPPIYLPAIGKCSLIL